MILALVVVLSVWIPCVSTRTWGEHEFAGHSAPPSLLRFPSATPCAPYLQRKIHSHSRACRRKLSENQHGVQLLPSDLSRVISDERTFAAQSDALRSWPKNRQVGMHLCNGACQSKSDSTLTVDSTEGHVGLRLEYAAHSVSQETVQVEVQRVSLLDVVDETAADSEANSVRRQGVDSSLLRYAGLTLSGSTETGSTYDVDLPPSLTGIDAQVMRISPATLLQVGLILHEFTVPMGAVFSPSGDYVALVYRKISSFTVYTLPPDYRFGGPVVGIITSASNSTAIDPSQPEGSISLPANSYINISLPVYSVSLNGHALCAFFALNGSVFVGNLSSRPNYCLSTTLGDFALVVKSSTTTSPAQTESPSSTASEGGTQTHSSSQTHAKHSSNWRLIVGMICLSIAGLAFLVAIALITIKLTKDVKRFIATRHYTGNDEALQDSLVGGSMAPSAPVMRTKPALEIDATHFSH